MRHCCGFSHHPLLCCSIHCGTVASSACFGAGSLSPCTMIQVTTLLIKKCHIISCFVSRFALVGNDSAKTMQGHAEMRADRELKHDTAIGIQGVQVFKTALDGLHGQEMEPWLTTFRLFCPPLNLLETAHNHSLFFMLASMQWIL